MIVLMDILDNMILGFIFYVMLLVILLFNSSSQC